MKNAVVKVIGLGSRIKDARKAAGLTQQAVADSIGLTVRSYQKYEEGSTEPSLNTLISLAIVFDVTTDQLLGLADEALSD